MLFINTSKSIVRSKGRNILIGIIVLTIALSSSIALAIRSAAERAKTSGLENQTITGSISVDRQRLMQNANTGDGNQDRSGNMEDMRELMQQYTELDLDTLKSYADSNYVSDFYYTASLTMSATGELEPYSTSSGSDTNSTDSNDSPGNGMMGGGRGGSFQISGGSISIGDFSVTGYSSEDAMTRFVSGSSKITEGEMFDINSAELTCLISYELATFNGLSVSDTITIANPSNEEETYDFVISGIFTNTDSSTQGAVQMPMLAAMDPSNLICVSFAALESIAAKSEEANSEQANRLTFTASGTYVFDSKLNYDGFEVELTKKGLSEYYALSSTDIESYEQSLAPLENLSSFATMLLLIVLGVGTIILVVINIFNIRERKYEVGVLTAIGIKKSKVAVQFILELLFVTFAATTIGTAVGAIVSVPVSNNLLQSQIESIETQQNNRQQNFGRQGGMADSGMRTQGGGIGNFFGGAQNAVEYIDTINATINLSILCQLLIIAAILTLFSSLAGIIFVLRYEPLKILANRA